MRRGSPPRGIGEPAAPSGLVEHFFRREYGRLVALLARRVGFEHLEAVEDAAQSALLSALSAWSGGTPDDPSAWLYRVAHNHLIGVLRQTRSHRRILSNLVDPEHEVEPAPPAPTFEGEVRDELLRMLFVCCDEGIPEESRLVLALKTLCGFSAAEIAFRLFTTEPNIYKRLARARERLRQRAIEAATPPLASLEGRLSSVHAIVYLLFNEGYQSLHDERSIRVELCDEAIRLGTLLAEHPVGAVPSTFALMALMHLHAARLAAREDATGGLLLLEEQDRSRWDREHLGQGARWLERAGQGNALSRFHVEAAIAAEHCFAPSFDQTRWGEIARLYALLETCHPSPVHAVNRAIAVAESEGARAGLAVLDGVVPPAWLERHYLWDAVYADLHRRAGNETTANAHRDRALAAAPSRALEKVLKRRLGETLG